LLNQEVALVRPGNAINFGVPRFENVTSLIQAVAERFPGIHDGKALKMAIAGPAPWLASDLIGDVTEEALLRALSITHSTGAYDAEELSIGSRSRRMWAGNPEGAKTLLSFLIRQNHNTFGEALLSALLETLGVEDAISLSDEIPGLLVTILRRDPSRTATPILWTRPRERQGELFDAATNGQELAADLRRLIVEAMLDADSDAVADKVFRTFGSDAVTIVLAWYDRKKTKPAAELKRGWIQSLAGCPEAILSWLTANPEVRGHTASLVARLLNPHSSVVRHVGIGVWLRSSAVANCELSDYDRLMVHGFSLALAFDNTAPQATDIISHSFDTVHDAVAVDRLSYGVWELWFNDVLPSLSWGRNRDKCENFAVG
jgi:hypothetical protein